jgi:acetyl esterase
MATSFYPSYTQGELDPQAKALLQQIKEADLPEPHTLTPQQVREGTWPGMRDLIGDPEVVANVENIKIPGPEGQIPIRVYTPEGRGPFPILVYFHGGGWVFWDIDVTDNACRSLANGASCVVVSVDYRLAPEHKYPAAVEDAYAATKWVATNAGRIQADPTRIAVGGDSAGGNLAAAVTLVARDRGGPPLAHQLLICPVTDVSSFDTDSYRHFGEGPESLKALSQWAVNHYLTEKEQAQHPLVSPLLAQDLSGLPPALVITAEFDTLRDEGEAYAGRLREAGGAVTCTRYDGMIHDFPVFAAAFDQAQDAIDRAATALRGAFAG